MQEGTYACGLFAIAFAVTLANRKDPTKCNFDQSKMRRHLYSCFNAGKVTCFPEKLSLEWFHVYCETIANRKCLDNSMEWLCEPCRKAS